MYINYMYMYIYMSLYMYTCTHSNTHMYNTFNSCRSLQRVSSYRYYFVQQQGLLLQPCVCTAVLVVMRTTHCDNRIGVLLSSVRDKVHPSLKAT